MDVNHYSVVATTSISSTLLGSGYSVNCMVSFEIQFGVQKGNPEITNKVNLHLFVFDIWVEDTLSSKVIVSTWESAQYRTDIRWKKPNDDGT
jgi:hypothetical protein